MGKLYDRLMQDIHLKEGLKACINCGTCTAICPAAEFYNYDPRKIANTVQLKDDEQLEELLKSETIWYCGECMSCKTRCPRENTPGQIIIALRALSQELGYFTESEKGRQQLYVKRTVGEWILKTGYCLYMEGVTTENHPEQGPVWDWRQEHWSEIMERAGANYNGAGPGVMRKIPDSALEEIKKIFDVTGATERFQQIEKYSAEKAKELGIELNENLESDYVKFVSSSINKNHNS